MKIKNNVCYCNKNAISNNFSAKIIAIKIIIAIISRILNKFFFLDLKEKSEDYSIFEKQFLRNFLAYSNLKYPLYILLNLSLWYLPKQRAFLLRKIVARNSLFFIANAIINNIFRTYCNCNKNNEKLLK